MFAGLVVEVEGALGLGSWAAIFGCRMVDVAAMVCSSATVFVTTTQAIGRINRGRDIWYLSRRAINLWLMAARKHIPEARRALPSSLAKGSP